MIIGGTIYYENLPMQYRDFFGNIGKGPFDHSD